MVGLCAMWGVIGTVRCAIRLIGAPGGSLLGKLVPAGLLAGFVMLIVVGVAEDLELLLRSR